MAKNVAQNQKTVHRCSRSVGAPIICPYCNDNCTKYGRTKNGNQRFRCKNCLKCFAETYRYSAYRNGINSQISLFVKEGLGIRSIARVLQISATTVVKRIRYIASRISLPYIVKGRTYEVDEIRTLMK